MRPPVLRLPSPALLPALALAVLSAAADPPDLTSAMEPLCNPNASRWTASQSLDLVCDRAAPFVLTVASTDFCHAGDVMR